MFTFSHTSICEMVANFTHAECVIKTAHSKIYKHLNQHSLFLLSLLHCLVARYGYLSRHIMYSFQMEIFCQNTKHILQRLLPCQNNTLYIKKTGRSIHSSISIPVGMRRPLLSFTKCLPEACPLNGLAEGNIVFSQMVTKLCDFTADLTQLKPFYHVAMLFNINRK